MNNKVYVFTERSYHPYPNNKELVTLQDEGWEVWNVTTVVSERDDKWAGKYQVMSTVHHLRRIAGEFERKVIGIEPEKLTEEK